MLPVSELLALYAAIASGDVRLTALQDPQEVYAGNVVYACSNGWTLTIFNDANEFDYVDKVSSPDGRDAWFDELEGTQGDWVPSAAVAWRCFGIPGYCKFRCYGCGATLPNAVQRRGPVTRPFFCGGERCANRKSPAEPSWLTVPQSAGGQRGSDGSIR
jgi:hypothetical protein